MIKKLFFICMVMLAAFLPAFAAQPIETKQQKIDVVFFTSPVCGFCQRCAREFLPEFKEKYKDVINFVEYNIFEGENSAIMQDAAREYGVQSTGVPAMVIGNSYFLGYPTQIGALAPAAIERALQSGEKTRVRLPAAQVTQELQKPVETKKSAPVPQPVKKAEPAKTEIKKEEPPTPVIEETESIYEENAAPPATTKSIFESITFWTITGAGLVDGINPCAFAVIVFFISFLTVYKYEKREIIIVGTVYCFSVFTAYILMGLGLFNFLYAMGSFYYVIMGFKYLTIALCALFFILSVYDLIIYKITGNADKILLQLPKSYKEYIHKVMRFFLKDKEKSTLRLILASAAVGFVVSLVEAVCTGQVYLPTIVLILKEADEHFWRAITYLLTYNLMFIVPLIVIFVLTLMGYESKGFNNFLKKHLALTKLLLSAVFLALLILLVISMR
ncbi:cytochrome c biogenesis protein CcdA [Elusimicrobium posterum]|uniref:hypothetical protein n=1 Tax=Elusimicrobium posterum TaxID=3116653 RepID=UPI003C735056